MYIRKVIMKNDFFIILNNLFRKYYLIAGIYIFRKNLKIYKMNTI